MCGWRDGQNKSVLGVLGRREGRVRRIGCRIWVWGPGDMSCGEDKGTAARIPSTWASRFMRHGEFPIHNPALGGESLPESPANWAIWRDFAEPANALRRQWDIPRDETRNNFGSATRELGTWDLLWHDGPWSSANSMGERRNPASTILPWQPPRIMCSTFHPEG